MSLSKPEGQLEALLDWLNLVPIEVEYDELTHVGNESRLKSVGSEAQKD